ncbi:hypothetical protein SY89_03339 [Halolamina pelagica]|uniref:Uncharacterized protein n=1 Tax=Halolamina pelagica TaxID=699431 RepID=A0A0P7HR20_9EURY|nr:hypothetical protein [Halolamina pelagica]KPN29105.1 hypothetical protein SY89_03339 [Halolamina pelagica]
MAESANPVSRLIAAGGQTLFMLTLSVAAVLAAVGLSLVVFGAFSDLVATTTDRVMVVGIGAVLMSLASGLGYSALN